MATDVTWRQVRRWRMRRQLLVEPAADAVAVARRVCGLHAQVTSCSGLIAGVRSAGTPDLATALWTDRTLVRTWAMRGTLHLLPAEAGWISPVLVVDGRVAGVWAHTVRDELATVTVTPFAPLSGAVRLAMEGYADRFASLLGVGAIEVVSR